MRVDLQNPLFRDGEHAARSAAGVGDGADDVVFGEGLFVLSQEEIHHEPDDFARREVFAGIFVEGFVELPDQLFEDVAHLMVRDLVRMQIDGLEPLGHLEQEPGLVELLDRVVEIELLQYLFHVRGEAVDVVSEIGGEIRRIGQQLVDVVAGGIVEGVAGDFTEERRRILQLLDL